MTTSIQEDRFKGEHLLLGRIYSALYAYDTELPEYRADARNRDKALSDFIKKESLISSVLSSAVSIDTNRKWTLSGTSRQVNKFSKILHSTHNGSWRRFVSMLSTNFYSSNFGYAAELGKNKKSGAVETMWVLDPTRLKYTGDVKKPIVYYPRRGSKTDILDEDVLFGNSMPSTEEAFNGLGFCAVERAMNFVRLMIGIYEHDLAKLGAKPPKGILHGRGIKPSEYTNAIEMWREAKENNNTDMYSDVFPFFTQSSNAQFDLIGFSSLPDNFDLKNFIDVIMQAFALAFGYDVGEFWSIQTGSFGRTGEMNLQQENTSYKGEQDFSLSLQEQLQNKVLPPSVLFSFNLRNDKGEQVRAEIMNQKAQTVINLYEAGLRYGQEPLINHEQALQMLYDYGVISQDFLDPNSDETFADLQTNRELKESLRSNYDVRRAAKVDSTEPIIQYEYNPVTNLSKNTIVYESGDEMLKRKYY